MRLIPAVIIDYDMGNVGSIANMIKKIGGESVITRDKKVIAKAKKIILPGVGAFDNGMANLKNFGLLDVLNEKVLKEKTQVLGVCLGMQLLSRRSEEGKLPGLAWIEANTVRFDFIKQKEKLRIPHMGWNTIEVKRKSSLITNFPDEPRFYFVHSYHLVCDDTKDIVAITSYGYDFSSIVEHKHIFGTQFHPEKSHKFGMQIYRNFLSIPC